MSQMLCKSLTFVSMLLVLSTTTLLSQDLTRIWSVQLPDRAASMTFSFDGTQYAYLINDSTICRASALNGEPLDTVVCSRSIGLAYCGTKLYVLRESGEHDLILSYLRMQEQTVQTTKVAIPYESDDQAGLGHEGSAYLFCVPGQTLMLSTNYSTYSPPNHTTSSGRFRFIDTSTHDVRGGYSRRLSSFSPSGDGLRLTYIGEYNEFSSGAGGPTYSSNSRECSDDPTPIQPTPSRGYGYSVANDASPITGLASPRSTGIPGLIFVNGVLFDLRIPAAFPRDTSQPYLVSNLTRGVMLACRSTTASRSIGTFNIISKTYSALDTVQAGLAEALTTTVLSGMKTLYLCDTSKRVVWKYATIASPRKDTAIVERSADSISMFESIKFRLRLFADLPDCKFRWYLDNQVVGITSNAEFTFAPRTAGMFRSWVEIIDSTGARRLTAESDTKLLVVRPAGVSMAFTPGSSPIMDISISPGQKQIGVCRKDTVSVYRLPTTSLDQSATLVREQPFQGGVSFGVNDDSLMFLKSWNTAYSEHRHRWYTASPEQDSIETIAETIRVRWSSREYGSVGEAYPMATTGHFIYNSELSKWYCLLRTAESWTRNVRDDALVALPDQRHDSIRYVIGIKRPPELPAVKYYVSDADVGYSHTLVLASGKVAYILDLTTNQNIDTVKAPADAAFESVVQMSDSVLATSLGVLKRDSDWVVQNRFSFRDGYRIIRLPNQNTFFVLRSNRDTIGHVVSAKTGEILFTLGHGFGKPECAVYDTLRRAIHVGDDWGVVSTWTLPAEYTTVGINEAADAAGPASLSIYPNPVDDVFRIEGKHDEGEKPSSVIIVSLDGQVSEARGVGANAYSMAGYASGLYAIIVQHKSGVRSYLLIKR